MSFYLLAFLLGVVAGLRAFTAPAAVSWGARLGLIPLGNSSLSFLADAVTPYIFTGLALLELVSDQLPKTPSRKTPVQFGVRLASGALVGGAVGAADSALTGGLVAGVVGAGLGTLGGAQVRAMLAKAFGRDLPAGLLEDGVAIVAAVFLVRIAQS